MSIHIFDTAQIILLRTKTNQAVMMDVYSKGVVACNNNIYSQIELVPSWEEATVTNNAFKTSAAARADS